MNSCWSALVIENMFRLVIILCLFLGLAGAGLPNQQSYEDFLKELAELKKRFQIPDNITNEDTLISGVDNGGSPIKNEDEKPKELSVSEPLLTDPGNKLEEEFGSEVFPDPKGISVQNATLKNDEPSTEIPEFKSILANTPVQEVNISSQNQDEGSQPEEKPLPSPPSEEESTQPNPETEVPTTEKETLTNEASSSPSSIENDGPTTKLHSHLPAVNEASSSSPSSIENDGATTKLHSHLPAVNEASSSPSSIENDGVTTKLHSHLPAVNEASSSPSSIENDGPTTKHHSHLPAVNEASSSPSSIENDGPTTKLHSHLPAVNEANSSPSSIENDGATIKLHSHLPAVNEASSSPSSIENDGPTTKLHSHLPAVSQLLTSLFRYRGDKLEQDAEPMNCTHDHMHKENQVPETQEETHPDCDHHVHTENQVLDKHEETQPAPLEKEMPKEVPNPEQQEGDKNVSQLVEEFHSKPAENTPVPVEQKDIDTNVLVQMDAALPKELSKTEDQDKLETTTDLQQTPEDLADELNDLKPYRSLSLKGISASHHKALPRGLPNIANLSTVMQADEELNILQHGEEHSAVTTSQPAVDLDVFNDIEDPNFQCPAEYGFFPDPNGNCTVYYFCHDGKAEKRVCGEGKLHFNPITKLCDHPAQALCELECPEVSGHYHVPGYCDMFLDCNVGQGKFIKCPAGLHFNAVTKQCDKPSKAVCEVACPDYNILVALPGRCNMYMSCEDGNATFHLCPAGLHFNPVLLTCDNPQKAGCDVQQCPSPDGYFPVLGQCGSYVECRDNRPKVHTCPSSLHFNFLLGTCDIPSKAGCLLKCEKPNGFFPYAGLCSYYIKCVGGIPSLQKCPKDMEFSAATRQCDVTKKDHCLPQCPTENGIFPVPSQCDLYVRCSNGQALVKRCPAKLHFNTLMKGCDIPERAKCQPECPTPFGVFPLPGKCTMFFRCENYTATILTCPQGLHYNARTLTCDWPASAHCDMSCPGLEGYYPVQGDCNAYVTCSNGHPTLKTCPHGKHFNFESERCDVPERARCHGSCTKDSGRFPLPGHCDSYIHCEDGQPHVDSCPPGLLFNRATATCDLPENVSCHTWLH